MNTEHNTALEVDQLSDEQFYVQSRPLIQYGPLSFDQLKELYLNEAIDEDTFIATSTSIQSLKTDTNNNVNSFRIIPNETPLWSAIHSNHTIFNELEDAISSFSKKRISNKYRNRDSDSSNEDDTKTNNQNVNFQVNMNVNGKNVPTMDINMNITNNKYKHSKLNKNNITRQEIEALKFEMKLIEEKNKKLTKLNGDLQKEITTLTAKYQSQYIDVKTKMTKQFEEYKKKRQQSLQSLQSEINTLRSINRNKLKNNAEIKHILKENEELSSKNDEYIKQQSKLIEKISNIQLNTLYYKTRYKALQNKYDLETFNYNKYRSDIAELKEQLLQKQSILNHSHQIMNSLLKNSITDLIPYQVLLNEIEGNHNILTQKYSINRNIIRLDALKVSELLSWHCYANKFHLTMELLGEYELSSRRARSRMKNVVSMLGEKIKSLNIHNITASELIHLSRDLKQSYETISSEQHLKEYELSSKRREYMKHSRMIANPLSPMMQPITPNLSKAISAGTYLASNDEENDHNYGISFGSMASLSMMDIHPGNLSRNQSLHSLSPSLDDTESIIAKHRKKSGTIKGSGLKLLTDQDTLNQYLEPKNRDKHNRDNSLSNSRYRHRHNQNNRSISRSQSHRHVNNQRNSPVLGHKQTAKYSHYSAFKIKRNNGSSRNVRHNKNSSISSNKSLSRSVYGTNNGHRSRKDNGSINSISALSAAGSEIPEQSTHLKDINESLDDEDDTDTVIVNPSPKKEKKITFDLDNNHNGNGGIGIPMFSPTSIDEDNENNDTYPPQKGKALSNDILSFFAM